ncbi:MAG: iron uptake porin [Symploca sp. SIO2B6]|nr:iron uptake porin [Symploca sp. SIO2B6]
MPSAFRVDNHSKQLNRLGKRNRSRSQVTNVSQLRDVQPGDWAYEALRSLVERYGCIAGYPDGSFRGNRALTRFEFAAGLNACLQQIERLISSNGSIGREDLEKLQRLSQDFEAELGTIGTRVDNLEGRVASLEDSQFSTTVSFGGEAIFALAGAGGGEPPGQGETNVVFNHLTRLGIASSFTGKDRLRLTLASGNFDDFGFANVNSLNTYAALLSYQDGLDNDVIIDTLEYRFAANNRLVFTFKPVGFSLSSVLSANSPYFDVGRGAISRFGQASPLFSIGALSAGAGFDWLITNKLRLQAAYGTRDSSDPSQGINGADHSALGVQLLANPFKNVVTGVTYVNAYAEDGRLDTFTGSFNADSSGLIFEPTQTHAIGGTLQWRLAPNLTLGTWGGWTFSNSVTSDSYANTNTYLVSLGISDIFGREGDLLALLFGQPPKLEEGEGLLFGEDNATSFHYEVFYRYKLNNHVWITPGFFMVTNPGNRAQNDTIYVGTIRTTFRF